MRDVLYRFAGSWRVGKGGKYLWKTLGIFWLLAAFSPCPAGAQDFAIVSPQAVKGLASQAGTSEGKYAISMAKKNLGRQPSRMAHVHVQGIQKPEIYDPNSAALGELGAMRDLALAYRLTGDKTYLNQATIFMDAWVTDYQFSYHPIDESDFDWLILADDLCREDFSPELQSRVNGFLRKLVEGYLASIASQKTPDIKNWQSHRIKLITMGAYALGDQRLVDKAEALFKKQVAANIKPDGSVLDFYERDALHYQAYDLEPLLEAADAAHAHGKDWFHWRSDTGSSLAGGVQWLVPYAEGEKTHQEFVHTNNSYDTQRLQAGVAEFNRIWDPKDGLKTLGLAAPLDPEFRTIVDRLRAKPGYYVNHWIVLAIWPQNRN